MDELIEEQIKDLEDKILNDALTSGIIDPEDQKRIQDLKKLTNK